MQLKEDLIFAGRYKLRKLLGRGGFSEVWLANDEWTNLDVAVKVYAPGMGMDEDGLRDFCKELSNVYNLNHTNLLKPQHVDTWEGMPYLVMAYCENGSCYRQVGKFTEKEAWELIADVASGLAYLHAQDIIHQDIKPDNILIDNNGNYVITDFGISVQARSTLRKSSRQASSGGTTAYMAPERFSREAAPVKASDIWSLGATVYELITGTMPFGEVGGGMQRGGAEIPTIKAGVSNVLRQTIKRMLAEDPSQRPTASLLADWAQNPSAIELVSDSEIEQDGGGSFLRVTPSRVEANPVGGEVKVHVKTDKDWRCYLEQQKWCSVEKNDHETFVVRYKPNQTGEERKTVVNIVAGPRASTVIVNQVSLPKKKNTLSFVLVAIVLVLGAMVGWKAWNDMIENQQIIERKIRIHNDFVNDFDRLNKTIVELKNLTDKDCVKNTLKELQKIEKSEEDPEFDKLNTARVFPAKLKEYRNNLNIIRNNIQKELDEYKIILKDNYETDSYVKKLILKKELIETILNHSAGGSVLKIVVEYL